MALYKSFTYLLISRYKFVDRTSGSDDDNNNDQAVSRLV